MTWALPDFSGYGRMDFLLNVPDVVKITWLYSLNKRFSKQSRGWWFETQSHPLWRHCNASWKLQRRRPWICKMRRWPVHPFHNTNTCMTGVSWRRKLYWELLLPLFPSVLPFPSGKKLAVTNHTTVDVFTAGIRPIPTDVNKLQATSSPINSPARLSKYTQAGWWKP